MAFTVYKSSAGSGKTYTLVREYLKVVLSSPGEYRHVLAITFTNKAANEMKERIIAVLKGISQIDRERSNDKMNALVNELSLETGLTIDQLRINSEKVLSSILHNYSDFAVSTIDSFIHRVIRSFAFDLNVPINFDVEMDTDAVLKQVIDVMISRAGTEPELTQFLIEFVRSKADEEKNWNIESDLLKIARLLKKEDNTEYLAQNKHLDLKAYLEINKTIRKFIKEFESNIQKLGKQATGLFESIGIPVAAFAGGRNGVANYFVAMGNGNFNRILPNNTIRKNIADDKWFAAKATVADQNDILTIKDDLLHLYEAIQLRIEKEHADYVVFSEIRKALYPLAILDKINQVLEEFKSENNILLIAEFNQLISEIVLDEPIPFIYERVGEKFKHFLVDEFQDTSILQWQNLIPLIDNSLAAGNHNLLVGDAKQAIYRWRNGEVEQFVALPKIFNRKDGQIHLERENALNQHHVSKSLDSNYRSSAEIVNFNNDLFTFARSFLSERDRVIYSEVKQKIASNKSGGYVQLQFYTEDENPETFSDYNCIQVKSIIENAQQNGYELEDMAILCRNNSHAGTIASYLLENQIQVVSSESVLLANSPKVRLITSVLYLLVNAGNQIAALEIKNLLIKMGMISGNLHQAASFSQGVPGNENENQADTPFAFLNSYGFELNRSYLLSLSLYDLCELLIRTFHFDVKDEPFVQFFLDVVMEQERKIESDLKRFLEFWEKKKDSLSIVVPEGVNAVKIMTIHKSKGLEFPLVIYPMVSESSRKTNDTVWINPENDRIPNLNAALVGANKTIAEGKFGDKVLRENEKSLLDLINLMYVAFTRPTDQFYIIAQFPKNIKSTTVSVSSILINYLISINEFEEGKYLYSFGQFTTMLLESRKLVSAYVLDDFISESWRTRAMISYQAPLNWQVEKPEKKQEWGNLIHAILSEIKTLNDLIPVLSNYLHSGIITETEEKTLKELIGEFLSRPKVSPFFSDRLIVKTESEIITADGKLVRPDRIVFDNDKMFVIDFKTGIPSENHKVQMQDYLNVMRQMEYSEASGVILYLNQTDPVMIA